MLEFILLTKNPTKMIHFLMCMSHVKEHRNYSHRALKDNPTFELQFTKEIMKIIIDLNFMKIEGINSIEKAGTTEEEEIEANTETIGDNAKIGNKEIIETIDNQRKNQFTLTSKQAKNQKIRNY